MHIHSLSHRQFLIAISSYCLFSWITFQITSGGWQLLVYQLLGGIFFLAIMIVAKIGVLILERKHQDIVIVNRYLVYVLMIYQSFYFIFNNGDCGDSPGGYTFIETVIQGSKNYFCFTQKSQFYSPQISLWLMGIYIVMLAFILLHTIFNSYAQN